MRSLIHFAMSGSSTFMYRGREQRIEEAAVLAVPGRIDLQGDERHRLAEIDRLHARGELLGMAERVLDGIAPDDLSTEGAGHDRTALPGLAVEGLGLRRDAWSGEHVVRALGRASGPRLRRHPWIPPGERPSIGTAIAPTGGLRWRYPSERLPCPRGTALRSAGSVPGQRPAAEVRRALLGERRHALGHLRRAAAIACACASRSSDSPSSSVSKAGIEHLLGEPHRADRARRRAGLRARLPPLRAPRAKEDTGRRGRATTASLTARAFTEQDHRLGTGEPDQARQEIRTARRRRRVPTWRRTIRTGSDRRRARSRRPAPGARRGRPRCR